MRSTRRASTRSQSNSNLAVVEPDGSTHDAATEGSADISNMGYGTDGWLYMSFSQAAQVGGGACMFARLAPEASAPECIDRDVSGLLFHTFDLDDQRRVYYLGTDPNTNENVIRRSTDGQTRNMATAVDTGAKLAVTPDGTVIYSQSFPNVVRRILPTGQIETIGNEAFAYIRKFPDGNLYFSTDALRRYLSTAGQFDPKPWIGTSAQDPYYVFDGVPIPAPELVSGDGRVLGIGRNPGVYAAELFPDPQYLPQSQVVGFPTLATTSDALVISGLNSDSKNVTTLYDLDSGSEQIIVGPSEEIEIRHLAYSAGDNRAYFSGLRFADGQRVFGAIDLGTLQVSTTPNDDTSWESFLAAP